MPALLHRLRPLPTPEDALERAAMQEDRARSARAWLVAGVVGAHAAAMALLGSMGGPTLPLATGVAMLALWLLAMGTAQALLLVRVEPQRRGAWLRAGAAVLLAVLLAPLSGLLLFVGGGMLHVLAPIAVAVLGVIAIVAGIRGRGRERRPAGALLGLAAALAAVVLNAIDTLVLLPAALLPGATLEAAYAALAAGGEGGAAVAVAVVCGTWAVAAALLAVGLWALAVRPSIALGWMLAVAAAVLLGRSTLTLILGWALGDVGGGGGMSVADAPLWLLALAVTAAASWLLLGRPRDADEARPAPLVA